MPFINRVTPLIVIRPPTECPWACCMVIFATMSASDTLPRSLPPRDFFAFTSPEIEILPASGFTDPGIEKR